jgi:cytochrome b6-f complex iron-sulfur subunit
MADEPAKDSGQGQESEDQAEEIKVNRREFLNLAWLASLGILTINLGVVTYLFALPQFREGEFGGAFSLGPAEALPESGSSPEDNPKGRFWLTRTEDGVVALYKVCTHLGCLYGWLEEQELFRCPCHGSQFFPNGDYKAGPAPRSLDRFVVQAVNRETGEVIAQTGPEGMPLEVPDDPNIVLQVDTGSLLRGAPK